MAQTDAPGEMTGKPLIESNRVEGTAVYDMNGDHVGTITQLMIEKISGKVAYAVISFGGFSGMGGEEHIILWGTLTYDTSLGGYQATIADERVRGVPTFYREAGYEWLDRGKERGLADHYGIPSYWRI